MFISASGSARQTGPRVERPALFTRMSAVRPSSVDPPEQVGPHGAVGQVGGEHLRPDAGPAELGGQVGELVGAAGDQGDAVAATSQLSGHLLTDARRGAGDESSAVGCWWGRLMGHKVGPSVTGGHAEIGPASCPTRQSSGWLTVDP